MPEAPFENTSLLGKCPIFWNFSSFSHDTHTLRWSSLSSKEHVANLQGGLTPMRSRPVPVTVAAVIQALFSLLSLPGPLLPGSEGVPAVVLFSGVVLGVAGLVASAGLWILKNWGLWLTIVVNVLGGLSAAPGVGAAPNAALQAAATAGVLISA